MSRLICNSRGIGLVEVVLAVFLVAVGICAIYSMQPSAWRVVGKSDYLGRGAGILRRALETREAWIMNPCNQVPNAWPQQIINVSGVVNEQGPSFASGDASYTVDTVINPGPVIPYQWTVTVTVTWLDQLQSNYRNLSESLVVSRQEAYRFPQLPVA